jgi:hypothetical protein
MLIFRDISRLRSGLELCCEVWTYLAWKVDFNGFDADVRGACRHGCLSFEMLREGFAGAKLWERIEIEAERRMYSVWVWEISCHYSPCMYTGAKYGSE